MTEQPCAQFPDRCPNLRDVPADPPHHGGGIRCGCNDPSPSTPAAELRTAATRIRELAAKATSDICPDWVYSAVRHIARNCAGSFECHHPEHQGWDQPEWDRYDDSPYIAAMHPAVGSALADLLDTAASYADKWPADHQTNSPFRRDALALARAVNGTEN